MIKYFSWLLKHLLFGAPIFSAIFGIIPGFFVLLLTSIPVWKVFAVVYVFYVVFGTTSYKNESFNPFRGVYKR